MPNKSDWKASVRILEKGKMNGVGDRLFSILSHHKFYRSLIYKATESLVTIIVPARFLWTNDEITETGRTKVEWPHRCTLTYLRHLCFFICIWLFFTLISKLESVHLFQEQCEILVVIECPPNSFSFLNSSKSWKKKTKSLTSQHGKNLISERIKTKTFCITVEPHLTSATLQ